MGVVKMNSCEACGFPLDNDSHKLCLYCFGLRNRSSSKFILFLSMKESGNKFRTIQEILELTNNFRDSINKPHTSYAAIYQILHRYSKYKHGKSNLLLTQKTTFNKLFPEHKKTRAKGASNQKMLKYKLSARLEKRVDKHFKKWKFGLPLYLGRKLLLTQEQKKKARVIRNKISKGDYGLFDYILV